MESSPSAVSRRDFVKSGSAVLGGLAAALPASRGVASVPSGTTPVPQVVLGRTAAKVSRLGIGCAYFQRNRVSPDDVTKTLRRALELGVNYLDAAPNYGNADTGFAEEKISLGIRELRDKFFLVTKTEQNT